ncbi:MAG: hypothetical protein U9O94_01550 [Nanoarchaeota archaeon]|nr:hypothetical protein [Nanoarchaeota archaeon]
MAISINANGGSFGLRINLLKERNGKMKKITEIKTTFGGPCVYKRAIFEDGSYSGRVQDVGQSKEKLEQELREYAENGKDDAMFFVDSIMSRGGMDKRMGFR